MNPWQMARQLKKRLDERKWPGVGGEKVFGSVLVTDAPFPIVASANRPPWLQIIVMNYGLADGEHHDGILQTFELYLGTAIAGSREGEAAMLGGYRVGGFLTSKGRGLLEVEPQLLDVAGKMNPMVDGLRVMGMTTGATPGTLSRDMGYVSERKYTFQALGTTYPTYPEPLDLSATVPVAGQVSLTWVIPTPGRYDLLKVILRRAAGSTPPPTPTSGTDVPLSGPLATSVLDTPGAGTWSYSLFAAYDETGDGIADQFSAAATVTVTA